MGVLLGFLEEHTQLESSSSSSSSTESISIAVVDRGGRGTTGASDDDDDDDGILDLRRWYFAAHPGRANDNVCPVPTTITGRKMDLPTGQGLGGSSNINAGIVMPPRSHDYTFWPEPWSSSLPEAVEFLWRRLEDNGMLHKHESSSSSTSLLPTGADGWQMDWSASSATLEVEQAPDRSGTSTWRRKTYFEAIISPIFLSKHSTCQVEWILDTQVQRLLLEDNAGEDKIVRGVECYTRTKNSKKDDDDAPTFWSLYASKAVILCAGALESPALLLTSGIGPESSHPHFQGVGRHLRDQWLVPRTYLTSWQPTTNGHELSTNGIASLGHLTNEMGGEMFQVAVTDSISHENILPSTLAMAIRWSCKSALCAQTVDMVFESVKLLLLLLIRFTPFGFVLRHFTRTTLIFLMHPRSEGHISIKTKLTSSSVSQHLEPERSYRCQRRKDVTLQVDVGYSRDPGDVDAMRRAWRALEQPSLKGNSSTSEVFPKWVFFPRLFSWLGLDWFPVFCRFFSQPYFHFSGTCSMRQNDQHLDWVVDSDLLRLRDHQGLYICDASVFPSMVSSPPALTCCALGYAFSKTLISTLQQEGKDE